VRQQDGLKRSDAQVSRRWYTWWWLEQWPKYTHRRSSLN